MRIVSWNMGGGFAHDAELHQRAWEWVRGYRADAFLLQETVPPEWAINAGFSVVHFHAKDNDCVPNWGSGVFARPPGWQPYAPQEQYPWLNVLAGSCAITQPNVPGLPWLISVHSSAKPMSADTEVAADIPRCDDEKWWEIDLIADSLSQLLVGQPFIIGADLNSSLLFRDSDAAFASARLFDNLRNQGFIDLRTPPHPHPEPQTFFRDGNGPLQLDYFLADHQTASVSSGWTVLTDVVTTLGLSDHAPIQVDLGAG